MDPSSVQKIGAVPPRRERLRFLLDGIEVRGTAPVGTVSGVLDQIAFGGQLVQSAFHCGAGELQVSGNRPDPRPAFALGVRAILEIHIDGHGPVRDIRVGVDSSKETHTSSSFGFAIACIFLSMPTPICFWGDSSGAWLASGESLALRMACSSSCRLA